MATPRIKTIGGLTLNLADIKCFRPNSDNDYRNILIIQFKARYDYIVNPETGRYEKQEYNENVEVEFTSYDSLVAHRNEWIELWDEYLRDHEN